MSINLLITVFYPKGQNVFFNKVSGVKEISKKKASIKLDASI
jgi:hypothetical protein